MRLPRTHRCVRPGAVAPLLALMLIPLLGMIAFSVDLGYLICVRTEIQNSADAAAMAGAQQLMNPCVEYFTPGNQSNQSTIMSNAVSLAKNTAKAVSAFNTAGGIGIQLADADVDVGYVDATGTFYSSNVMPSGAFPNSVQVTAKRDGNSNAQAPAFFAPIFGVRGTTVAAFAQATNYTVTLNNLANISATGIGALPMTFDVNDWNAFVAGQGLPNNDTRVGADGDKQIKIYPSIKDTGNFGMLSLDANHAGASTIRGWVDNGLQQSDLTALQNAGLIPLSSHNPNIMPSGSDNGSWDWVGNPGFKASVVMDVNAASRIGQSYLLPLFKPLVPYDPILDPNGNNYKAGVGQGSHYDYNIVQFVAVTITSDVGDNRSIFVKPSALVLGGDQALSIGQPVVAGQPGSTPSQTIFLASRLTQ